MEEQEESEQLVERVAALDIGKAELVACVRVPHPDRPGRRVQEVRTFATTTRSLIALSDWLSEYEVTLVAMEATSDYWKPAFYLLEDDFECWLLNARSVKNVPGRPKTDRLDAVWLSKVLERGMCRPSFVPERPFRQLRDLTRYRRTVVRERTRDKQRVEKTLEDAQIKLSSVVSDLFGVSGRDMLEALIAGQRDPHVLAEMARGSMRRKITSLVEALTGHFAEHHAFLCQLMLERIDAATAQIGVLTSEIELRLLPYASQVEQLREIPGVGATGAQEILAEIGVDMTRFPTAAHLVSWARFCPSTRESAGKKTSSSTGKGDPWLASALGESAIGASRTSSFLGARYRRIARRRGKRKALVAVGNSQLTICWHLLSQPDAHFNDLGPHWHDRLNPQRRARTLRHELERLTGQKVTLTPLTDTPAA